MNQEDKNYIKEGIIAFILSLITLAILLMTGIV